MSIFKKNIITILFIVILILINIAHYKKSDLLLMMNIICSYNYNFANKLTIINYDTRNFIFVLIQDTIKWYLMVLLLLICLLFTSTDINKTTSDCYYLILFISLNIRILNICFNYNFIDHLSLTKIFYICHLNEINNMEIPGG